MLGGGDSYFWIKAICSNFLFLIVAVFYSYYVINEAVTLSAFSVVALLLFHRHFVSLQHTVIEIAKCIIALTYVPSFLLFVMNRQQRKR